MLYMDLREELHTLIDGLDVSDAKRRLHVLVAALDEETVHRILAQVAEIRRRRLAQMGPFFM